MNTCPECNRFLGNAGHASTCSKRGLSPVASDPLLGKIKTAWCHYNALNAELEYSLSEGGDTDVTRDQVNHAWEDLNSLIMPNAESEGLT